MAEREELILEIRAELDLARSNVEALELKLNSLEDIQIDLDVDTGTAAADIDYIDGKLNAVDGRTADATVEADDRASNDIDRIDRKLDDIDGRTADATVEADDRASADIDRIDGKLDSIDGRTVKATVDAEAGGGLTSLLGDIDAMPGQLNEGLSALSGAASTTGAIGLAAGAMAGLVTQATQWGVEVAEVARLTGASTEEVSRFLTVWKQAGYEKGDLLDVVAQMTGVLADSPEIAAQLGIALDGSLTPLETMRAAIEALNSEQLSANDRILLGSKLFGEEGVRQINGLVSALGGDLQGAIDGVSESVILSQAEVDKAVAMNAEFKAMIGSVQAVAAELGQTLLPPLERALEILNQLGGLDVLLPDFDAGSLRDSAAAIEIATERLREATQFNDPTTGAWGDYLEITREAAGATDEVASSADRLNDAYAKLGDPLRTMPELWQALIQDAKDGAFEWENAAGAIAMLTEATGLSEAQILSLIKAETEQVKVTGDLNAVVEENAAAWVAEQEALAGVGQELATVALNLDEAAIRAAGFSAALDQINESSELTTSNEVIDFVASMNSLGEALRTAAEEGVNLNEIDLVPDSWGEVLNMPEELGPVVDAITAFRENVQSEMAQAFESGGQAEVLAWAESTRDAIVTSLNEAGVTSEEAVDQVLSALGLLPDQIDMAIALSGQEQALATIALMQSAINGLPLETQLQIAAVASTDPVAALQVAIDAFAAEGIAVPVELTVLADQLQGDADAAVAAVGPPSIPVSADTTEAEEDIAAVTDAEHPTTIAAQADLIQAQADLIDEAAKTRTTIIAASALTTAARLDLDAAANEERTATINVNTGSINLPSSAQLAGQIGPVRVSIIGVWSTRLEGSRPR